MGLVELKAYRKWSEKEEEIDKGGKPKEKQLAMIAIVLSGIYVSGAAATYSIPWTRSQSYTQSVEGDVYGCVREW